MDQTDILHYSRQIILKAIGAEGQKKLFDAKVLVIGAGGLDSPALLYLAAAPGSMFRKKINEIDPAEQK